MKTVIKAMIYQSALLGVLPFLRPSSLGAAVLLWPFKLLAGALSPLLGLVGGLGALLGFARRDWKLAGVGAVGLGLATRYVLDVPNSQGEFDTAFGPSWPERVPASLRPYLLPRRWSPLARPPGRASMERDLVYGQNVETGGLLLADVWQPLNGVPRTGLAVIFVHGGGWRIGDKDMGTRPLFQRLAGQGHLVMDIAYTLWPQADIPTMITEVKQAILWLKENASTYGVDPDRLVLMGGSAGGHLALMGAYTAGHPAFSLASDAGDTTVRGVVAFYPPTDFLQLQKQFIPDRGPDAERGLLSSVEKAGESLLSRLFKLSHGDLESKIEFREMMAVMLGGDADQIPEAFRLLSPSSHVGPHCPPTLLLQGSDDVFQLAPAVRRFHQDLRQAGVPTVLVDFPHTDHAFDLLFPRISPVAQASTYDVERFLALLV